jgi:glyoxylase-like metal-dependent hydrolase (beta-lactamase superfamily II)
MTSTDTTFAELHASPPTPLSFAPGIEIRSFLLRRDGGDLLVYGAPEVPAGAAPVRHYLGHEHETMFLGADRVAPRVIHAADHAVAARRAPVDETFSEAGVIDGDLELVPIPGHTPGSAAYLWDSGAHRFLFTADSVMLDHGEWVGALLKSSDRDAYLESLALLRDLDFDVLVPWAATAGEPFVVATDRADAVRRLTAIIDRIRAGATG